jgi:hypothetical protein
VDGQTGHQLILLIQESDQEAIPGVIAMPL